MASADVFTPAAAWAQADGIGKFIYVVLITMSLWSWFIMITKALDTRALKKVATDAEKNFWSSTSLKEGASKLAGKINPFRDIVQDGLLAAEHHKKHSGEVTAAIELSDWIESHVRKRTDMLQGSLQQGMVVLASVGATAPFVGLFGTVWGIMGALRDIAIRGQADLSSVSGPIGEALIMTALGLAVAVPAVIGFNTFTRANKGLMERVNYFSHDVQSALLAGSRVEAGAAAGRK
jgi:biopolymer transport protein ExbB